MKQTVRILFLLMVLAWASVGDACAASGQRKDRLRWNDVSQQEAPKATFSDTHSTVRLVPTRPQRITPSGEPKTPHGHGRTFSALYTHNHFFSGNHVVLRALARAVLPMASCGKTFIALRHIIR